MENKSCQFEFFKPGSFDPQIDERKEEMPFSVWNIILSIIGMVTNLHILIIFSVNSTGKMFIVYLKLLSFCDFMSCFGMFCKNFLDHLVCPLFYYDIDIICKLAGMSGYSIATFGMYIVIAITFDRYIHICKPLNPDPKKKKVYIICMTSGLAATVVSIPIFFMYGERSIYIDGLIHATECLIADNVRFTHFPFVYFLILDIICLVLTFIVIYLYIKIKRAVQAGVVQRRKMLSAVRNAKAFHMKMDSLTTIQGASATKNEQTTQPRGSTNDEDNTMKLTVTAMVITALFFVSYWPFLIIMTIQALDLNGPDISRLQLMVFRFGFNIVFINNICNPFVYFYNNPRMRQRLVNMYRCRRTD